MLSSQFKLTRKARDDLLGIGRYTEQKWGRQQRNTYLKALDNAFCRLAENPDLGQDCSDIKRGYKKYLQSSHLVFFRLSGDGGIEVIRVLHKRMDVEARLKRI